MTQKSKTELEKKKKTFWNYRSEIFFTLKSVQYTLNGIEIPAATETDRTEKEMKRKRRRRRDVFTT